MLSAHDKQTFHLLPQPQHKITTRLPMKQVILPWLSPPPAVSTVARPRSQQYRPGRGARRSQHSFRVDGGEAQMAVTAFYFYFIFLCFLLTINKPSTYFHSHSTKYYVDVIQCHLQFSDDVGVLRPVRPCRRRRGRIQHSFRPARVDGGKAAASAVFDA